MPQQPPQEIENLIKQSKKQLKVIRSIEVSKDQTQTLPQVIELTEKDQSLSREWSELPKQILENVHHQSPNIQ